MVVFLKRYTMALAVITTVMIGYSLTISRWIEPDDYVPTEIPNITLTSSGTRWWEQLFQPQDWQSHDPTVVQNSRGVLLAKAWQQIDQRTWKLTPLTIVLTQQEIQENPDDLPLPTTDAWVINAPEGATIHFDRPLDLNSGRVPSIQRGQLDGAIEIYRVSVNDPRNPSLELRTKNLSIDRRQIWTQDEVFLSNTNLLIEGRTLRIHLLNDILSQQASQSEEESSSRYGPLDELELMHLTVAKMRLAAGGIWSRVDPKLLSLSQALTTESPALNGPAESILDLPAIVEAECGGRFSLNFSKEIAVLNGGVHLRHQLGSLSPDEFQCHRAIMKFGMEGEQGRQLGKADQLQGLTIRELEAYGIDSLEDFVGEMWVEVNCPLVNASARAKRVRFDFRTQRIELAGKLDQPGATVSVAELNYRGYHLRAPNLEYKAAPQATDGSRAHSGWMVAQGEGEFSAPADSQVGSLQIRWRDRLQWSPSDKPGEQWLEVAGQTLVESKNRGFVASDRIQLWLSSLVPNESLAVKQGMPSTLRPIRMVSLSPTSIGTGSHLLQVDALDLKFIYPSADLQNSAPGELTLRNSTGTSIIPFLSQPSVSIVGPPNQPMGTTRRPIQVRGKSMNARLVMTNPLSVDALTLQGPLTIQSDSSNLTDSLSVTAQTLLLAAATDGNIDMQLEGSPAVVKMAGGSIEGPSIRFNQRENQVWMDQPGVIGVPMALLQGKGPDGFHWEIPPQISWQGRMKFDGNHVRLDGGIRLSGTLNRNESIWLMEGFCQDLSFSLSERMDFQNFTSTQLESNPSTSHISEIVLSNSVDLRVAKRDAFGKRQSLQRLQVPEVKIYVPDGKIVAAGPGEGVAKFVSDKPLGVLTSTDNQSVEKLTGAHLRFRDSLTGLLHENEIVVDGNVQISISPIASWEEDYDLFSNSLYLPGQMSLSSDQLKLFDTGMLNSTREARHSSTGLADSMLWEVQATGNVILEGISESGAYSGRAYQATWVQSKDQLTLRGDGRSKAMLKRIPPSNSNSGYPTTIHVPLVSLNVETMAVDIPQGGLDLQVDFQGGPVNNGSTDAGGLAPPMNGNSIQPPNPRESINNFLRGY